MRRAEATLQEELHVEQAVEDVARLVRTNRRSALLIVQLVHRFQCDRLRELDDQRRPTLAVGAAAAAVATAVDVSNPTAIESAALRLSAASPHIAADDAQPTARFSAVVVLDDELEIEDPHRVVVKNAQKGKRKSKPTTKKGAKSASQRADRNFAQVMDDIFAVVLNGKAALDADGNEMQMEEATKTSFDLSAALAEPQIEASTFLPGLRAAAVSEKLDHLPTLSYADADAVATTTTYAADEFSTCTVQFNRVVVADYATPISQPPPLPPPPPAPPLQPSFCVYSSPTLPHAASHPQATFIAPPQAHRDATTTASVRINDFYACDGAAAAVTNAAHLHSTLTTPQPPAADSPSPTLVGQPPPPPPPPPPPMSIVSPSSLCSIQPSAPQPPSTVAFTASASAAAASAAVAAATNVYMHQTFPYEHSNDFDDILAAVYDVESENWRHLSDKRRQHNSNLGQRCQRTIDIEGVRATNAIYQELRLSDSQFCPLSEVRRLQIARAAKRSSSTL